MPPRWNAWTHLQAVHFDYERQPKMRRVRLAAASPAVGELARIGMSGVEVECVIVSVAAGLLTVKVKRSPAKAERAATSKKRRRA